MIQESLITISEASQILSVSEATLRQWTDEGKIKAFITPGGHRRYAKLDLRNFMRTHRKILGIKDLVAELEGTAPLHREIARTYLNSTALSNKLNEESQELFRDSGRQFLNLIIRYITEPAKRPEIIELSHHIGHDLGETLTKLGFPLTESVEAFLQHRSTIMEAVTHLLRRREAFSERIPEAIPLIDHLFDEALVSLVAAYKQYRNGVPSELKGGSNA